MESGYPSQTARLMEAEPVLRWHWLSRSFTGELIACLHQRVLRQEPNASKNNDLPVGISGPISRTRKGRRVAEYNFGVTIPRFGDKPTNVNVYIGTENTITDERYEEALAKAIDIRKKAERAYQTAATKAGAIQADPLRQAL